MPLADKGNFLRSTVTLRYEQRYCSGPSAHDSIVVTQPRRSPTADPPASALVRRSGPIRNRNQNGARSWFAGMDSSSHDRHRRLPLHERRRSSSLQGSMVAQNYGDDQAEVCPMKVPLTRGMFAIIDDADWPVVSRYTWHAHPQPKCGGFQAKTYTGQITVAGRKRSVLVNMQTLLMGNRPGFEIDHRNRNPLDNRRSNLRWATYSQQLANRAVKNKTGFRGVAKNGKRSWMASIQPPKGSGKRIYLGTFKSPEEAAAAYQMAARELWGEFACFDVKK